MIQYIIAAGIGAFLGSRSKKSKKSYAEGGVTKIYDNSNNEVLNFKVIGYQSEDFDNEETLDLISDGYPNAVASAREYWNSGNYGMILVQPKEDDYTLFELTQSKGEKEFSKGGSTYEDGNLIIDNSEIKNLTYYRDYEEVEVVSDNDSGYVTIRYDEEQNDREYILINNTVYYLDDIEVYAKGGKVKMDSIKDAQEHFGYDNSEWNELRKSKQKELREVSYKRHQGGSSYAHGGEVDLDAISKNPPYAVAIDMYGEGDPDDIFVGFYKDNRRYGGGRSYHGRGAIKYVRWSMKDVFNGGYEPKIFQTIEDYRAWKKSGSKMAKGGKTRKKVKK